MRAEFASASAHFLASGALASSLVLNSDGAPSPLAFMKASAQLSLLLVKILTGTNLPLPSTPIVMVPAAVMEQTTGRLPSYDGLASNTMLLFRVHLLLVSLSHVTVVEELFPGDVVWTEKAATLSDALLISVRTLVANAIAEAAALSPVRMKNVSQGPIQIPLHFADVALVALFMGLPTVLLGV